MVAGLYQERSLTEPALKIYEQGLKRFPDNPELEGALARLYVQTKAFDKAIALYEKLFQNILLGKIKDELFIRKVITDLGEAYFLKGNQTQAITSWWQLVNNKLFPEITASHFRALGEALEKYNLSDELVKVYEKGLETLPQDIYLTMSLYRLYRTERKTEQALKTVLKAYEDPNQHDEAKELFYQISLTAPSCIKKGIDSYLSS